ncbi:MAG: Rhodanese-like domain protein [Syntrophaceae bacterium PtaU1.Bin231]|nr:MAG: Rhodanese-like domain protein [Syntrophaceae bacterium PtaU1.Bin231]
MLTIRWSWRIFLLPMLFLFLAQTNAAAFRPAPDVPRISIEQLKAKMDAGENIVIIDMRSDRDYQESNEKIKGAVRISVVELEDSSRALLKGKEIITYCS